MAIVSVVWRLALRLFVGLYTTNSGVNGLRECTGMTNCKSALQAAFAPTGAMLAGGDGLAARVRQDSARQDSARQDSAGKPCRHALIYPLTVR